MGHYDDCYASADCYKMKLAEKKSYFNNFQSEMNNKGYVHAYYDDVRGLLLQEWAKVNKYEIKNGYKDITVINDLLYIKSLEAIKGDNNVVD